MDQRGVKYPNLNQEHVAFRRRRLPHWEALGCAYFVTFRTADSMSREEEERIRNLREELRRLSVIGGKDFQEAQRRLFRYYDGRLDLGRGSCPFFDPEVAGVVGAALVYFDGDRYDLGAWCVMPNHVHAIIAPNGDRELSRVLQSWKSFTAKQINRALGRTGRLWQEEYFDHLIRSAKEHERFERYVLDNPLRAGLLDWHSVSVMGQTTI